MPLLIRGLGVLLLFLALGIIGGCGDEPGGTGTPSGDGDAVNSLSGPTFDTDGGPLNPPPAAPSTAGSPCLVVTFNGIPFPITATRGSTITIDGLTFNISASCNATEVVP